MEPIHIISLGAGVQSSTMALMAAAGEITPMPVAAIFADTQDEPESVYTWLDWLEKQLPFPIHRVTKGQLSKRALEFRTTKDGRVYTKTDIPFFTLSGDGKTGMVQNRLCTFDFKIAPIIKAIRKLAGIKRGEKEIKVIQWIGISLDEISRMKPSRERWIENRWPLIELRKSRGDCVAWMTANNFPKPPRSACVFCPYHSDHEWRNLRDTDAVAFEKAVAETKAVANGKPGIPGNLKSKLFLHRSCKPLAEVDFSTEEERGQLSMFNNDCAGMCGV